jgi:DNA-binding NtrC family response regulator
MNDKPIILIVDDEEESLERFRRMFEDEDYTVLTADDSTEALGLVEREKPSIVILSLTTSDVSEIKVLRRIKKMDENIEVVIITGYGTMKVARAAMELGAYDYVTKPFEDNYIKALITIALSPVPEELLQLALE